MATRAEDAQGSAPAREPRADRDEVPADRFRHLPPAVPIAAAVALVGVVPTVPLGPEGAVGGADGD